MHLSCFKKNPYNYNVEIISGYLTRTSYLTSLPYEPEIKDCAEKNFHFHFHSFLRLSPLQFKIFKYPRLDRRKHILRSKKLTSTEIILVELRFHKQKSYMKEINT